MTRRNLPLPRRSRRRTNTTRLLGHTAFVAGIATSARICAKQAAHVVMHRKPAHTHTPTSAQRTSGATRGPTTNACARNTQRTYYHSDCKEPTHTGTLLRSEWCGAERCACAVEDLCLLLILVPSTIIIINNHHGPSLLSRHADGAIQSDHLAVQHLVLADVLDHVRILIGVAKPGRERDLLRQSLLRAARRVTEWTVQGHCGPPAQTCAASGKLARSGVLNKPGATVLTRMPWRASSRAMGSVMPTTAPLDAEYAAWPICPSYAATLRGREGRARGVVSNTVLAHNHGSSTAMLTPASHPPPLHSPARGDLPCRVDDDTTLATLIGVSTGHA